MHDLVFICRCWSRYEPMIDLVCTTLVSKSCLYGPEGPTLPNRQVLDLYFYVLTSFYTGQVMPIQSTNNIPSSSTCDTWKIVRKNSPTLLQGHYPNSHVLDPYFYVLTSFYTGQVTPIQSHKQDLPAATTSLQQPLLKVPTNHYSKEPKHDLSTMTTCLMRITATRCVLFPRITRLLRPVGLGNGRS